MTAADQSVRNVKKPLANRPSTYDDFDDPRPALKNVLDDAPGSVRQVLQRRS